jgi:hypothetical protein
MTRSKSSVLVMLAVGAGAAGVGGVAPALGDRPVRRDAAAHAARTISVRESVHASNVSHQGNTLINDRGRGTGTFNCPVVMQVRVSYTKGSVHLTCTTSVGNVTAGGSVSFFTAGQTATFTGTAAISHGTGRYSHASGRLRVEGTMQRKTFALVASASGTISY